MRLNLNKYIAVTAALLCFSNVSFASSVVSCETKSNNGTATFDYGDADVSSDGSTYVEACHDTNRWQQLGYTGDGKLEGDTGDTSDADNENKGWTGEQSQNNVDLGDNGVKWKVQNQDGSWPDKFQRKALTAGANVVFEFVVKRSTEGNHQFDQLKSWSDWNGNGKFEDNEVIIDAKWQKNHNANDVLNANSGNANSDLGTDNNKNQARKYYSEIQVPYHAVVSDTWIRARVICENSLTAYDRDNNIFLATGYYHQGEVEDYKVAINPVPEPTTLLVFGSALIGLVLSRKKTK
jgi:hypothetical protein